MNARQIHTSVSKFFSDWGISQAFGAFVIAAVVGYVNIRIDISANDTAISASSTAITELRKHNDEIKDILKILSDHKSSIAVIESRLDDRK